MSKKARQRNRAPRNDANLRQAKRERQAAAQRERERARVRAQRLALGRKVAVFAVVAGVAVVAFVVISKRLSPRPIPKAALAAGRAAGCASVESPAGSAPGGQHLAPGQVYHYTSEPATSGPHDPSPLPSSPHVYTESVPETQAVHNLEHAYVLVYYRDGGPDALPTDVVQALTPPVNAQFKTIMAPFPNLPTGTSFALLAWNKLWTCPATITADQARTMTSGFIHAFRGTGNAPEPSAP